LFGILSFSLDWKNLMKIPKFVTPRLQAVTETVRFPAVADVGCDHAYALISLALSGRLQKGIAADARPGPLARAAENIWKFHLEALIETRLCDGLSQIAPREADAIVIAGMGGELVNRILAEGEAAARAAKQLVLQPMTALFETRRFLYENGYTIANERLAAEGEKLYVVLDCVSGEKTDLETDLDFHIGKKLLENRDPLLERYINGKLREFNKILRGLQTAGREEFTQKISETRELLTRLHALKEAPP
jgi:tRNA (adenine22-N1)-methyltransferase